MAVLYSDSFNSLVVSALPHVGWNSSQSANPTDLSIDSSINRTGAGSSLKVFVTESAQYSGTWRSELRTADASTLNKTENWFGFSVYFSSSYDFDVINETVWQLHATEDPVDVALSPPVSLRTLRDNLYVDINWSSDPTQSLTNYSTYQFPTTAITKDQWTDFVMYVKWSYGTDGIFRVWKDQSLVIEHYGPNTYNDQNPPYHKLGIYKAGWTDPNSLVTARTLWYDEYKVADSTSVYSDVDVGGNSQPTVSYPSTETVVFRETFPNFESGSTKNASNIGWKMMYNTGSQQAVTGSSAFTTPSSGSSTSSSLNVGYNSNVPVGYLYSNPASHARFHYTDKQITVDRTTRELTRIKFCTAHGSTAWRNHLCVKVAGSWYLYDWNTQNLQVSNAGSAAANDPTAFATYTLYVDQTVDNTKWRAMTVTENTALSVGGTDVSLPAGNITGVGLYSERSGAATNRLRYDDVTLLTTSTVSSVPITSFGGNVNLNNYRRILT